MSSKYSKLFDSIRNVASNRYKATVPLYDNNDTINQYGSFILGKNAIKNEFYSILQNIAIVKITQKRAYEHGFRRLKVKSDTSRMVLTELYANPIPPLSYDPLALDRILKVYNRDIKSATYVTNRQDIFPMTDNRNLLASAFRTDEDFTNFLNVLINDFVYSNEIVEEDCIKQAFNVNFSGGAFKSVNVHGKTSAEILKMIKTFSGEMSRATSDYNNYINIEGATGDPVVTSTPKENQILMLSSQLLADLDVDVWAGAFNIDKATAVKNIVDVGKWDFRVYDRENQKVVNTIKSKIVGVLFDEAGIVFEDDLQIQGDDFNSATLSTNHFWHIWQKINFRPWCNFIVLYDDSTTATDDVEVSITPTNLYSRHQGITINATTQDKKFENVRSSTLGLDNCYLLTVDNKHIDLNSDEFASMTQETQNAVKEYINTNIKKIKHSVTTDGTTTDYFKLNEYIEPADASGAYIRINVNSRREIEEKLGYNRYGYIVVSGVVFYDNGTVQGNEEEFEIIISTSL